MLTLPKWPSVIGLAAIGTSLMWGSNVHVPTYGVLAVLAWMLLVLTFIVAHAPEKTTSEMIRESR
jgi:hypothetical protein